MKKKKILYENFYCILLYCYYKMMVIHCFFSFFLLRKYVTKENGLQHNILINNRITKKIDMTIIAI